MKNKKSLIIAIILMSPALLLLVLVLFIELSSKTERNYISEKDQEIAYKIISHGIEINYGLENYKKSENKSAFIKDKNNAEEENWRKTSANLFTNGYIKESFIAPYGSYNLLKNENGQIYFIVRSYRLTNKVCLEINRLNKLSRYFSSNVGYDYLAPVNKIKQGIDLLDTVEKSLENYLYGCYKENEYNNIFMFKVKNIN